MKFEELKVHMERLIYRCDSYEVVIHGKINSGLVLFKLAEIQWREEVGVIDKSEIQDCILEVSSQEIRMIFESLRESLIQFGLIPRPLVEDEVKTLREQLNDCIKTRDALLEIIRIDRDCRRGGE